MPALPPLLTSAQSPPPQVPQPPSPLPLLSPLLLLQLLSVSWLSFFCRHCCCKHIHHYSFAYGSKQCHRQSNAHCCCRPLFLCIKILFSILLRRMLWKPMVCLFWQEGPAKMSTVGFYSNSLICTTESPFFRNKLCKLVVLLCKGSGKVYKTLQREQETHLCFCKPCISLTKSQF